LIYGSAYHGGRRFTVFQGFFSTHSHHMDDRNNQFNQQDTQKLPPRSGKPKELMPENVVV
jgi:hypothetical protein